ncbi:MAG: fibronectin type III domain-containing protein, partial [Acidobacteriota bacterium]|nr:fibronectin type III domain-containing protein [Acidobacteriota bacterium]
AWQGTVATLSWSPPSSVVAAPDLPTSYIIEAGRASGAIDVASFNVGNVTSYATDVLPGTYFVRVRGANAFGVSDPSNEIVLQGPGAPGRPLSLSASGTGSAVNLRWNAPTSGGSPTGYTIEAGSAPGLSDLAVLTTGNQTTLATTAPPGTYYVRVRAVNARGASDPSNEIVVRR